MIVALLAAIFAGPDAAPALAAVERCDLSEMQALTKAEPRRRTEWAAALYAEQQAIARERAEVLALRTETATPETLTASDAALSRLDWRQHRVESARAVETGWRNFVEELRVDFLANCKTGAKGAGNAK